MENAPPSGRPALPVFSNADIADRLAALAQLLSANKENPYKVKAYQRAAAKIRTFSESIDDLVPEEADLTQFAGQVGYSRATMKIELRLIEHYQDLLKRLRPPHVPSGHGSAQRAPRIHRYGTRPTAE